MDSSGRVHLMDIPEHGEPRHSGFMTRDPMPEECDPRKVLKALDKLADRPLPIPRKDAALLPLTPFERGFVLATLAAYREWREGRR